MGFILSSLRQVLFQKASESQHEGRSLAALYVKVTATLFAMALVPTAVMLIWGPQLFAWVFGAQWFTAGELSRSLMIWMAVVFCNLPAVLFGRIIRIQRFVFFYDLGLLAARTAALVLGGLFLSAYQTVMALRPRGGGHERVPDLRRGPGRHEKRRLALNLDSL